MKKFKSVIDGAIKDDSKFVEEWNDAIDMGLTSEEIMSENFPDGEIGNDTGTRFESLI